MTNVLKLVKRKFNRLLPALCMFMAVVCQLSATDIWSHELHKRYTNGRHFARDTIQNPSNTDGFKAYNIVMPYLSDYHNPSSNTKVAVKLDGVSLRQFSRILGISASNIDLFLNIQYDDLEKAERILFQPHKWLFSSIPIAGGIIADTSCAIYRSTGNLQFSQVQVLGDHSANAHDGLISPDTRHIADMKAETSERESSFYISTVRMNKVTSKYTAEAIVAQPVGKIAITLHMLLGNAPQPDGSIMSERNQWDSKVASINTLNDLFGVDYQSPAWQSMIDVLRVLRDGSDQAIGCLMIPFIPAPHSLELRQVGQVGQLDQVENSISVLLETLPKPSKQVRKLLRKLERVVAKNLNKRNDRKINKTLRMLKKSKNNKKRVAQLKQLLKVLETKAKKAKKRKKAIANKKRKLKLKKARKTSA